MSALAADEPDDMNTMARVSHQMPGISASNQVRITVALAGRQNYHGNFLLGESLYQVKVQALHHFRIPLAAAGQYGLRYKGDAQAETLRLAGFGQNVLHFTLLALATNSRFGETLFLR